MSLLWKLRRGSAIQNPGLLRDAADDRLGQDVRIRWTCSILLSQTVTCSKTNQNDGNVSESCQSQRKELPTAKVGTKGAKINRVMLDYIPKNKINTPKSILIYANGAMRNKYRREDLTPHAKAFRCVWWPPSKEDSMGSGGKGETSWRNLTNMISAGGRVGGQG